jgi:RNA polymerase sigma factor for flagellar operon FliA
MIATQTQETQELPQTWQTEPAVQEPVSREDKIRSLLYLVQHIAGRVVAKLPAHVAKEDLISAGVVGLIDAVDRFDAGKGCSLKTYSSLRIHGAMVDELRRQDWVPRTVHRDEKIYEAAAEKLAQKLGRQPEQEEIRQELKMTPEAFEQFLERTQTIPSFSLNESWSDEDGNSIDRGECMANTATPTALEEMLRAEDRALLREELNKLPRAEKIVLCLYYMEDLRLKEIALILEVSESRVSQIHTEALRKITAAMRKAHAS